MDRDATARRRSGAAARGVAVEAGTQRVLGRALLSLKEELHMRLSRRWSAGAAAISEVEQQTLEFSHAARGVKSAQLVGKTQSQLLHRSVFASVGRLDCQRHARKSTTRERGAQQRGAARRASAGCDGEAARDRRCRRMKSTSCSTTVPRCEGDGTAPSVRGHCRGLHRYSAEESDAKRRSGSAALVRKMQLQLCWPRRELRMVGAFLAAAAGARSMRTASAGAGPTCPTMRGLR